MLPQKCKQDVSKIWPSDLHFDPTQPMIELDQDISKKNILTMFEEEWTKMWPLQCKQEIS